jgi:two-component system, cell cycle sensor histidine kinase and response regulator CckA
MEPTNAKGRILVMDDEEFIRDLLALALGMFGFKTLVSSHGAEAIELFELAQKSGRPFDGLIIDIHIKNGLGGVETISRLLKLDAGVKAMVSSADANHPAMLNYRDFGFESVLPKPYSLSELQKGVHNLIQKKA